MKHMIFSALMMAATSVWAQAPAKEAAKPEPTKEAAKQETAKQETAKVTPRKGPRRWNEDARHCLEKPTNTEIIKCAEEYL